MIQTLFMSLFLSYLTFDVPRECSRILLVTRDDPTGFYAVATPYLREIDEITLSEPDEDDQDCDCEEERRIILDEVFEPVVLRDDQIIFSRDGDYGLAISEEEIPEVLFERDNGELFYLKKKST